MTNNMVELIPSLKTNNILLDEAKANVICKQMESKVNIKNVTILYSISQLFKLSNLLKISLSFIERCFPIVAESKNFLELDFVRVGKILSSSELNIDSELQVLIAANVWLSHNTTERSKYAKNLLIKIRLSLLSNPALNHILKTKSSFSMNTECAGIIREVLENKKESHWYKLSTTSRYCNQDKFNIIVCGGKNFNKGNAVNDVCSVHVDNANSVNKLAPMIEGRNEFETVCIKNEVYLFGGKDDNDVYIRSIEKYSPATNTWEKVADVYDERKHYCGCSFVDKIYFIGGSSNVTKRSCVKFNINDKSWKEIADMKERRKGAACVVFEGKVVVSGGLNDDILSTVESYDDVADSWSYMPNMNERRAGHKSVAIKNKLFVFGGCVQSWEVFDSNFKKFLLLKQSLACFQFDVSFPVKVLSIGSKLTVFLETGIILLYDYEKHEWSVKACAATEEITLCSIVKLP